MKKILVLLVLISPLFLKAQITGCDDEGAVNYYCNTDAGNSNINPKYQPLLSAICTFTGMIPTAFLINIAPLNETPSTLKSLVLGCAPAIEIAS